MIYEEEQSGSVLVARTLEANKMSGTIPTEISKLSLLRFVYDTAPLPSYLML